MTPEKLLDYSVKFGLLPLAFLVIILTRADLKETQKDVKELQLLLIDCYQDKAISKPHGLTKSIETGVRFVAVLPDKFKIVKEAESAINIINQGEGIPVSPEAVTRTYCEAIAYQDIWYIHTDEVTQKYLGQPIEIEIIHEEI